MPATYRVGALTAVLALMLIAGGAQAQSCNYNLSFNISSEAISLALMALTISFLVVAIGYFISKIVPASGIQGWLRNEYWEIGKSALLIASIFAVMTLLSSVALMLYGASSGTSVSTGTYSSNIGTLVNDVMNDYFCSTSVYGALEEGNAYLTGLSMGLGALKTTSIGLYIPLPLIPPYPVVTIDFGFTASPYVNPMLESTSISLQYESAFNDALMFIMLPASIVIFLQMYILPYLIELAVVVLIPIGLILRAFPFIRGVGGTLIAIGIGAGIIYPAMILLFNLPITNAFFANFPVAPPPSQLKLPTGAGNPLSSSNLFLSVFVAIFNTLIGAANQVVAGFTGFGDALNSFLFSNLYVVMNGLIYYTLSSLLQLVLFAIDLIIIFPAIDAVARMLGGTIRLSLGGRMKLI